MNPNLQKINTALSGLLMLFYVSWWGSLGAPSGMLPLAVLAIAVVPLALLLPALWTGNRFGTTLAGLLIPFHFAYAVMELVANPAARGWIAVQTFLSLVLLITVMASLRQVGTAESN